MKAYIKHNVRKYYLFGVFGFRAYRTQWGYCDGDAWPSRRTESKWFKSYNDANIFIEKEKPEPPPRQTAQTQAIIDAIKDLMQSKDNEND